MGALEGGFAAALLFLAPGFVAAWVLGSLTADKEFSELQRIVQALVFSVFIQPLTASASWVALKLGQVWLLGEWTTNVEFGWSIAIALVLGLVFATLVNSDLLFSVLRKLRVTGQTSRPSVWYSAFRDHTETYAVIQLVDDRRLYGWVSEWPSIPGKGHLKLDCVSWLEFDGSDVRQVELPESAFILLDAGQIKWVEFLPKQEPSAATREGVEQ